MEGGGGQVYMEKVCRSSNWWEVKDWGESVSELIIKKDNYKKLYIVLQETVLSTLLLGCFYLLYLFYSNLSRVYCC